MASDFRSRLIPVEQKADAIDFRSRIIPIQSDEGKPSKIRSLASAPLKGLVKGAQNFSPLPSFGPVSRELGEKITEQLLPTRKGETAEDILEFAGENLPLALMGEGGLLKKGTQALTAGLAKKGAKEAKLPEWAQDVVGGVGMAAPSVLKAAGTKALRPSSTQKAVVDFLKDKGLSEKDITPIIQNKKKLSWLSKAAFRYEKEEPWLKGIRKDLGNVFQDIREKGAKAGHLDGKPLRTFEDSFYKQLDKVPRMYQGLIKKEVEDLFNRPINFTELHDFEKAINAIVGGVEGGKAAIGLLKDPIKAAEKAMNPDLYRELQSTNAAYSKLANFTEKMTKKDWDGLIKLGNFGGGLYGILTLNPALIKASLGIAATRIGLRKVLTDPRLQNIHLKIWDAFLKHRIPQALRYVGILKSELDKKSVKSK